MSQKQIFHSIAHTRLTSASRRPRTHIVNIVVILIYSVALAGV